MAASTCIKCGWTKFETVAKEPNKSAYKLLFTQCTNCGGVVGVTEFYNIGALVHALAKALKVKL